MNSKKDLVAQHGYWDQDINAYRVIDPTNGRERFFRWQKPWPLVSTAIGTLVVMCCVSVAAVVSPLFFEWPEGVAGDKSAQLQGVLSEQYKVSLSYVPVDWTPTQVFTVDVTRGWDDPDYDQPAQEYKSCKLQPGARAEDLSLQCPMYGAFADVEPGGLYARGDYENRVRHEQESGGYGGSGVSGGGSDPYYERWEQREFDASDYVDDTEMWP